MEYKYKAFISYNHNDRDSRVARLLHNRIETYTVPRKLRKNGKKKPGKVFRDQEELSASSDLNQHIRDALDESEFLIVICSPGAVASKWVCKEIAYFLEHHAQEKLLTVLTGGDGADIYKALLPGMPEPLSLDLTGIPDEEIPRKLKERFLKLCAPLLGCEYDDLVMRDQKRQRRIFLGWLTGITAVAAVIIGILLWSNFEINARNQEVLLRESAFLTQEAKEALDAGDRATAIEKALAALPSEEEERPYYALAEQTLFTAIEPFSDPAHNYIFTATVLEQNTSIVDFCISSDGKRLTTVDQFTNLNCFDTVTGALLWSRQISPNSNERDPWILSCHPWNSVIYFDGYSLMSLSQDTGRILWSKELVRFQEDYLLMSEDHTTLVAVSVEPEEDQQCAAYQLLYLSTEDGIVQSSCPLVTAQDCMFPDIKILTIRFPELNPKSSSSAVLTPDGSFLGFYYSSTSSERLHDVIHVFRCDPTEQTCTELYTQQLDASNYFYYIPILHMEIDRTDKTLLCVYGTLDMIVAGKYHMDDLMPVWETTLPARSLNSFNILRSEHWIYVQTNTHLFRLHPQDGTVIQTQELGEKVADFCLSECSGIVPQLEYDETGAEPAATTYDSFVYLLEDGSYSFFFEGTDEAYYTHYHERDFHLGACSAGQIWNNGNFCVDTGMRNILILDEDNGGGYVALIPAEDDHRIIIRRPRQIPHPPTQKTISLFSDSSSVNIAVCANLYFQFNMKSDQGYYGRIIDLSTSAIVSEFDQPDKLPQNQSLFLSDGSGCIIDDDFPEYLDFQTGQLHILWDWRMESDPQTEIQDPFYKFRSIRLSRSSDVLTVCASLQGLKLYVNGQYSKDAAYPKGFFHDGASDIRIVTAAENGYVLVVDYAKDTWDSCMFYDYFADEWHHFPKEYYKAPSIRMGNSTPILLIADSSDHIRIYDIPGQRELRQIPLGISNEIFLGMTLSSDDSLLIAVTHDRDLRIYDLHAGKLVYAEPLPWDVVYRMRCYDNPERGYLFLLSDALVTNGICMSTDTWEVFAMIPDLHMYHKDLNLLLQHKSDYLYELTLTPMPTTEEMIALGHQFLGK